MNKINKCLFPVAGYGTRFLPATKAVPKEMLPIFTKPLIQYGVEEAMSAGITQMAMVTSKYKGAIKQHFEPHPDIENIIKGTTKEGLLDEVNNIGQQCSFSYIKQEQMLGLGHAIHTGKPLIGKEPFAVILPDDLCIGQGGGSILNQMRVLYEQYHDHCIVAIEDVPKGEVDKYGIVDGVLLDGRSDLYQVKNIVEKPNSKDAKTTMAVIGRYILTPDIFDILSDVDPGKNNEIQITDALAVLARQKRVLAYRFQGKRFDCGSVEGFLEANHYFADKLT